MTIHITVLTDGSLVLMCGTYRWRLPNWNALLNAYNVDTLADFDLRIRHTEGI